MSEIYTVSFFGQKTIDPWDIWDIEPKIANTARMMIETKEHVDFIVGLSSELDFIAADCVRRMQKVSHGSSTLILSLPYPAAEYLKNMEQLKSQYDKIEINEKTADNNEFNMQSFSRSIIDRSNLVVFSVYDRTDCAYKLYKYAKSLRKRTMNVVSRLF